MSTDDEITLNVVHRPPANVTQVPIRCLSTIWPMILSRPVFVETHITWYPDRVKVLILSDTNFLYSVDCKSEAFENGDAVARKLEFDCSKKWSEVWHSYGGMVLASDFNNHLHLLNPTILDSTMLFQLPSVRDPICGLMYALGYSRSLDDYIVVQVSCHSNAEDGAEVRYICLDIYELKKNTWQEEYDLKNYAFSDCSQPHLPTCRCRRMIAMNGCLHWFCTRISDSSPVIIAYDLEHKTYLELSFPFLLDEQNVTSCSLIVCEERLCIVVSYVNDIQEDVWMMMEHLVESSWTKISREKVARSRVDKILEDKAVRGIPAPFKAKLFFLDSVFLMRSQLEDEEEQFDAEEQHIDDDEQHIDDEEQHIDAEEQQVDAKQSSANPFRNAVIF